MTLLNAFRQALSNQKTGQVDTAKVMRAAMGVASAMDAYASDHSRALLTHIVVPWALAVAKLAPHKWLLPTGVEPACMMEVGPGNCGSFAVGGCHVCGRPICINHALIAGDATLCCWTCMRTAAKHAEPWQPPVASAAPAAESTLHWAYEILGVEASATDAQVKSAFRKRIASLHPDKNKGEEKAHEDVVRLITKANEAIKKSREAF